MAQHEFELDRSAALAGRLDEETHRLAEGLAPKTALADCGLGRRWSLSVGLRPPAANGEYWREDQSPS